MIPDAMPRTWSHCPRDKDASKLRTLSLAGGRSAGKDSGRREEGIGRGDGVLTRGLPSGHAAGRRRLAPLIGAAAEPATSGKESRASTRRRGPVRPS